MDKYVLSKKAQEDIEEIFEYGNFQFGKEISIQYLIDLESCFELLSENSSIGKKRNEIKIGLYSFPFVSHVFFTELWKVKSESSEYFMEAEILESFQNKINPRPSKNQTQFHSRFV